MTARPSINAEAKDMSTVLYEQAGRIVTITIDRPDAMNAIDPETRDALVGAWTRFPDDDVEGPKAFVEKRKPNFQAR